MKIIIATDCTEIMVSDAYQTAKDIRDNIEIKRCLEVVS